MAPFQQVWVIEAGRYSDRKVIAVCATRDEAQQMVDHCLQTDEACDAEAEQWNVGEGFTCLQQHYSRFTIRMARNGDVLRVYQEDPDKDVLSFSSFYRVQRGWNTSDQPPVYLVATVWAQSEEHAIKIAGEFRTQSLAQNEWENV